ncbi:MAG TPA: SDR family NAD(P)-dependent oxidoreductase [Planctomycetes bacterium]|nr:SDR family NAD(P)-dependent oxidoreductase [Planctomycetota bacterium]
MQRKTLILGATSAIAAEVAKLCAARGDQLYLVGRDPDKLHAVVAAAGDAVVGFESCDLNEFDLAEERVAKWLAELGGLDRALIAHGYLGDQERSERDMVYVQQVIGTNFISAVSLLMPLANFLESQGHGHLGAITSVAGERGRPRNYTYGAAKGGLTCYLEGLRSRLYKKGVRVHNLKLGPVETPMSEGHPQNALWGEKRRVAAGIVRAMERRWHTAYLPRTWGLVMAIVRLLPEGVFQRFGFLAGR